MDKYYKQLKELLKEWVIPIYDAELGGVKGKPVKANTKRGRELLAKMRAHFTQAVRAVKSATKQ